jgi:hypothetical protein
VIILLAGVFAARKVESDAAVQNRRLAEEQAGRTAAAAAAVLEKQLALFQV